MSCKIRHKAPSVLNLSSKILFKPNAKFKFIIPQSNALDRKYPQKNKTTTLSNFSPKLFATLTGLLLLPCYLTANALSATTANTIQGTAPYLTFDGGTTKATNADGLLSIKLSDGTQYTPLSNPSTSVAPITLPSSGETFADVDMFVPIYTDTITLNTLIGSPYNYWGDDDGDGQTTGGITVTGSLTVTITDKNNQTVNRTDELSICKAPYKVVLSSTNGNISTQYGNPNTSSFNASSATYYIEPKPSASVCFAKPDMTYATGNYAGPLGMWDSANGFILQSTNTSSYNQNFPTTGANGLYFDLNISGLSVTPTWDPVTVNGITATMSNATSTSVRVTLTGPVATAAQIYSTTPPGTVIKPTLPAKFELKGNDSTGTVIKYGFELNKWFINRAYQLDTLSAQTSWCSSTGYNLVKIMDLTNASGTALNSGGTIPTPLQTPSAGNWYERRIGGGLFSEWGFVFVYSGANFVSNIYWTSENNGTDPFFVGAYIGDVLIDPTVSTSFGLCTF